MLTESLGNGQYAVAACGQNCPHNGLCKDEDFANCPAIDKVIEKLGKIEHQEENKVLSEENTITVSFSIDEYWKLKSENDELKRIILGILKEKYY